MSCGLHLDMSLDEMEETRFKKRYTDLVKKLCKELPFSYNEIESLLLMYYKFQKNGPQTQPAMTKTQFIDFLHNSMDMTDSELCELTTSTLDKTPSPYFPMETWCRTLALFLRGSLEEKTNHCFKVYTAMGYDVITRDQMVHLMSHALIGEEESEEVTKDLVEVITKKIDVDRDGKVSLDDFKETVKTQPLLLEAFGQCLPSRTAVYAFLTTFTTKTRKM